MKMYRRLIFVFLSMQLVGVLAARAQVVGVEIMGGFSTYQMKGLKKAMDQQLKASALPLRLTDDFPSFVHAGFQLAVDYGGKEVGFRYSRYSTGARVHYQDYSGEYGFDITLQAHMAGVFTRMSIVEKKKFHLKASFAALAGLTYGSMGDYLRVGEEWKRSSLEIAAESIVLEPFLIPTIDLTERLYIGFPLGASIDLGGNLHLKGDRKAKIMDDAGNSLQSSWLGWRSELILGFTF